MTPDGSRNEPTAFLSVLLSGAVWGALGGYLEIVLLERYYSTGFRPWLHCADLLLNYMCYGAAGAAVFYLIARLMRVHDPAKLVIAALMPLPALATGAWFVLKVALPARAVGAVIGAAVALLVIALCALLLYRATRRTRLTAVAAVAVFVCIGTLKEPITAALGTVARGLTGGKSDGSRNVILILTDTLRADYLSCYGFEWNTSPALSRLASGGALFERHISQSTWTLPATASLLTGLYPSSHGANAEGSALPDEPVTLAESMKRAGYRTAAFTENRYVTPRFGFGQGFETFRPFWDPWLYKSTLLFRVSRRVPHFDLTDKEIYPDDLHDPAQLRWDAATTVDRALSWLDKTGDAPFFLYVHFMNPHGPYGPREYLLEDPARPAERLLDHPRDKGGPYPLRPRAEALADATRESLIKLYAADIRYVDNAVGRLLAEVDRRGLRDETLVIFTADHGEEFYEHGSWNHGASTFQSIVHVPLIVSCPGLIDEGIRVHPVTRTIDVMPTILELTGRDVPERVQGRSLRGHLGLGAAPAPLAAYTEGAHHTSEEPIALESVTTEEWKLMRVAVADDEAVLLYDLANDPGEITDLAAARPAMRDSLLRELGRWNQVARMYRPDTESIELDPATVEELRALGYVK